MEVATFGPVLSQCSYKDRRVNIKMNLFKCLSCFYSGAVIGGLPGVPGSPGLKGERGVTYPGVPGFPGSKGQKGEQGGLDF